MSVIGLPLLLGQSPAIESLRAEIERAARTHAKVLVLGETGVGKEIVAKLIHAHSHRNTRPFIAVNCSGIPETLLTSELFGHARGSFTGAYRDKIGLVRQADKGTLFLDELGEMSLAMQATLLRFAETGEIQPVGVDTPVGRTDVRLVTATNRDLRGRIASGDFREDLYYRLNVIQLRIPPLRERGEDVLLLFNHYLAEASATHHLPCPILATAAAQLLLAYAWPGNVRELRNMTERLSLRVTDGPVTPEDLPAEVLGTASPARSATAGPAPQELERSPAGPADSSQPLWDALMNGEDFWTVVQQRFRAHEITRGHVETLIDRGLRHTRGSYRALVRLFNMPETDYKRFHAFLYQQNCNLPVATYRRAADPVRLK